ncbi:MAG: hypothetical protein V4508_24375 [Pseudomonadota bacterium]
MNDLNLAAAVLRLRLAARVLGPLACGALLVCVLALVALGWLLPQRGVQAGRQAVALGLAALPAAPKPAPVSANENLALFYDTLGEKRYAEQQVKTLFGIAAKTGLTLNQGEYKAAFERSGRMHTYQVLLPVRGSYRAIWQFCLLSLGAIPFASLDELSFKRDSIGEPTVEARLRLTLYLADGAKSGEAP